MKTLLTATGIASIVFTIGTALHAFVIIDMQTLERTMVLAGADPAQAPGFLTMFQAVGCVYVVANAFGILALRKQPHKWLFWVVLLTNATQAAGVWMVPPEMWTAVDERFGPAGTLPSLVTDGGALILTIVLLVAGAKGTWGRKRPVRSGTGRACES